jgi:hypothetical protein
MFIFNVSKFLFCFLVEFILFAKKSAYETVLSQIGFTIYLMDLLIKD